MSARGWSGVAVAAWCGAALMLGAVLLLDGCAAAVGPGAGDAADGASEVVTASDAAVERPDGADAPVEAAPLPTCPAGDHGEATERGPACCRQVAGDCTAAACAVARDGAPASFCASAVQCCVPAP